MTATSTPERERDVDALEVVLAGALDHQLAARGELAPLLRDLDRPAAGQVLPGDRPLAGQQVLDGAADDDLAAVLAGARADVDDPVGDLDRVLVVLDDDERVAHVAQPDQRLDQPGVVPLVQPDRRLVEHVEDADQPGADLGGQPDALRLAAGQGGGRPVEGQVVEADVDQERQPRLDLLEHPVGDGPLALAQLQGAEPLGRVADREAGDLGDRPAVQLDGEDLRLEPGAVADGTGHVAHVALVLVPRVVAVGVLVPALEERHARPRTRRSSCARGRSGSCSGRAPGPASRAAPPSAPWPAAAPTGCPSRSRAAAPSPVSSRRKYSFVIELGPRRDRALRRGSSPGRGRRARGRPPCGCRCRCTRGRRRTAS